MIRCLLVAEVKMMGMSLIGAMRLAMAWVNSFIVLAVLSGTRSHLLTTMTQPFRLRMIRLKIDMSCASMPLVASIIRMQTSEFSMARMERSTE